jgi:glycosyltransferase involved in cell wall biosynthesis
MKIAFYIHHTTISAGGIYTYTIGILRQLVNSADLEKIIIITSKKISATLTEFTDNKKIEIKTIDRDAIVIKLRVIVWYGLYLTTLFIQSILRSGNLVKRIKKFISSINPYSLILNSNNIEIFHLPIQYSPIYKTGIPVIITMHDLQEFHFPQYFSLKERLHRIINNKLAINDSDQIICSFNHIKNDIIKYFRVDERKVSVCPPPFADDWFLNKKESDWNQIQKKYNLRRNYLLYPAATWQHKNHITLIEAVKKIKDSDLDIELVCTGNKTDYFSTIAKKIAELKLSEMVHFLGIVPEEDLISLYKNSSLVVIPTLYEAGSGPLYEAMRYQVPVICSNVTSLPDTVKDNEFLFDPTDVNELVTKIKIGLTDVEFRKRNIENSKKRMEQLRQNDYSKYFMDVYKKIRLNRL